MVELETVLQAVPALGVVVALLYYSLTIRNTEKIRRKDFIFQSNITRTPGYFDIWYKVIEMWDYDTYGEFTEKFSREQQADYTYVVTVYNVMGTALRSGVASADEVFQLYPPQFVVSFFEMSWPVVRDLRVLSGNVEYLRPFEDMYREARKKLPDYVPWWQRGLRPTRAVHP